MNHRIFLSLGCALLVAVPASTLLPGCGGGNSGIAQGTYTSTVALSATKTGFLTLTTGGNVSGATGTLRVANSSAADKSTKALTIDIPNGTYQLSGTFSPPNSFSVTGSFPGVGPFFISGQIPTNGGNGNYTIITGGQTVNGNFATGNFTPTPGPTTTGTPNATNTTQPTTSGTPAATATATSQPIATQTPAPANTATPTPTSATTTNNRVDNILFSAVSGVNASSTAPYSATLPNNSFFKNDGSGFVGTAFFQVTTGGVKRKLTFEGPQRSTAVSPPAQFTLGGSGEGEGLANLFYSEIGSNGVERSWAAKSGSYIIASGDTNKVSFSLSNVKFAPAFNAGGATGTFTLSGRGSVGR